MNMWSSLDLTVAEPGGWFASYLGDLLLPATPLAVLILIIVYAGGLGDVVGLKDWVRYWGIYGGERDDSALEWLFRFLAIT